MARVDTIILRPREGGERLRSYLYHARATDDACSS